MRLYLLFAFLFTTFMFGQLSDKHWLPPLHSRSNTNVNEHVIYLSTPVVTPFQVTVTNGNGVLFGTYTVSAGNPVQFTVGNSQPSNMFVSKTGLYTPSGDSGLILTGPSNFYVTFKVRSSAHGEVFVSKGRAGLGQDFRLGSVPQISNDGNRNFVSSIMATENNTFITVNDYNTGVTFETPTGTNSSGTQSFSLQAGESVVLSGYSNVAANLDGFIGAHLTSNKPVSVITGNITANPASTGNDICLDQIVPVEEVGTEYIVVKGDGISTTELPIVIGTENNTQIFVNGIPTPIATINAGDYYIVPFSYYQGTNNQNMYIESSKPVYLYQVLAGAAATHTTGLNFIPPLSCSYPKVVDLIPSINFLGSLNVNLDGGANLVILAVVGSVISINGTITTAVPQTVLGNANWVTYRIPNVSGNVKVESTGSVAVGVYGTSNTIGFASFYSGFGKVQISYTQDQGIETADMTSANGLAQCAGNVKVLNTNVDPDDFDFQWSIQTPTGLEDIPGEVGPSYTVTAPGTYCVTTSNGFVGSSCTQIDCIEVEYLPEFFINDDPTDLTLYSCDNNFDLSNNIPILLDGLNEFDYEIYFFSTEQDAIENENQISENQITNDTNTTFYTRVEDFVYGCPKYAQFEAIVVPPPTATISANTICSESTGTVTFTGTPGATVLYTVDGGNQQPITLDNVTGIATLTTPTLINNSEYCLVDVSFNSSTACNQTLSECATVTVLPLPTATISGDIICEETSGTVTFSGTPGSTVHYTVDNGAQETIILDAISGLATVTSPVLFSDSEYCLVDAISTDNCTETFTNTCATISIIPLPTASITGETICAETSGTITITGTPDATVQYSVDGSNTTQSIVLDGLGNATITTPILTENSEYCLINITSATTPECTKTFNTPICTTVIVNPLPSVSINGEDACLGEANTITFTGTPNAVVNYNFDTTPQTPIVLNASGSYILNSTNAVGPHTYTVVDVTSADTPSCTVSLVGEEITVNVLTSPVIGLITDIRVCDDNNDGYGTFDLSSAVSDALVGNSGTTVTIHETQADADFPSNALSLAEIVSYNNIVPFTQELFVRVENSAGCFTTTSFFVHVDQRPELNQNVIPYELCETSIPGDGFEVFDLTNSDLTNDITAGVSGLTVYYDESQADA
ncbi:IgGFc-binding protein [Flavobacterium sp.]|uniref:IgGFc-binding protein n=1 Tax=Flavobacterium sp. TaxID=239 RepID=UPI003F697DCD